VRHAEGFAAGVHEFTLQRVLGRERHGMEHEMQFAKFFAHLVEDACDVVVLGHVAFQDEGVRAEGTGEFLDVFLQAFALIGEGEFGALAGPGLGDGPGDGALVGDAKDDPDFSRK
jgi:hypothetical protein